MNNNSAASTWDAFCGYILNYAAANEDFVMVISDSLPGAEVFDTLPEEKLSKASSVSSLILGAAGYAIAGKKPWLISDSSVITAVGYGQIREALAIPSLPVKIVVSEGGLCRGQEGFSYNILEDVSLMRTLPHMNVFVPSDLPSFVETAETAERAQAPSYIRLSRTPLPTFTDEMGDSSVPRGARMLISETGVTICACGTMVSQALKAAGILEQQGIGAEVIDCYSVKPLPEQILLASVRRTGCCVVAEEQSRIGGLCGAVAECLCATYPVPVRFVAVDDYFVGSGMPEELREYHGLTWQEIVSAASQGGALRRR